MRLVKWKPTAFPTIFDDEDFFGWPSISEDTGLDIYETDDNVVVEAVVPGISEDEVDVSIEGNVLTVRAEHEETEEEKGEKTAVYKSSRKRSFNYSTSLPRMALADEAEASIENGVLKVVIPKAEEEKPRKIEVKKK